MALLTFNLISHEYAWPSLALAGEGAMNSNHSEDLYFVCYDCGSAFVHDVGEQIFFSAERRRTSEAVPGLSSITPTGSKRVEGAGASQASPLMRTNRQNPSVRPLLSQKLIRQEYQTQKHENGFRISLPVQLGAPRLVVSRLPHLEQSRGIGLFSSKGGPRS